MKGKSLSDGRTPYGKNRLTDSTIDIIENYYRLIIRHITVKTNRNTHCVQKEKIHGVNKTEGKLQEKLMGILTQFAIMEDIKPIFRDL
ncbi:hypothetical protein PR048_019753 [Dryococelus australis]|uniref:Uncharacterized protein n=1 Tax=Dryococelus australis TaxID=614101 RepID=A0ABQ9H4G3_9NEOP|nr:hypothetical protein PR048_019753 [Dryococelus australis]